MALRLSTTTRYGLRALIELAKNREGEFISLKEISKRQKIPIRYLENIMLKLVGGGIVVSSRGKGGGFKLSRDPSEIKISDVIEFLEGPISLVPCLEDSSLCSRTAKCETRGLWAELKRALWKTLEEKRLSDLIKEKGGIQ